MRGRPSLCGVKFSVEQVSKMIYSPDKVSYSLINALVSAIVGVCIDSNEFNAFVARVVQKKIGIDNKGCYHYKHVGSNLLHRYDAFCKSAD